MLCYTLRVLEIYATSCFIQCNAKRKKKKWNWYISFNNLVNDLQIFSFINHVFSLLQSLRLQLYLDKYFDNCAFRFYGITLNLKHIDHKLSFSIIMTNLNNFQRKHTFSHLFSIGISCHKQKRF